jgi:5-formyltetrahydrofolate cyclo-ligase
MRSWDEIKAWRRETRAKLLGRRVALRRAERERIGAIVTALLAERVPELRPGSESHRASCIGFCWPFKGEVDFRGFVGEAIEGGATAALPVVVERAHPLEFWSWQPRMKLQRGIWGIPVPVPGERRIARPSVLLVPLIGFDPAGYRLGYGGGYFDRTLAVTAPKPLTIGIGYELGRLETIHPQPHDIPMDAIVTENGFGWVARPPAPSPVLDRKAGR